MSSERHRNRRQRAQEQLTEAQDNWIVVIGKHGRDMQHPEVLVARQLLEKARLNYFKISNQTPVGDE